MGPGVRQLGVQGLGQTEVAGPGVRRLPPRQRNLPGDTASPLAGGDAFCGLRLDLGGGKEPESTPCHGGDTSKPGMMKRRHSGRRRGAWVMSGMRRPLADDFVN